MGDSLRRSELRNTEKTSVISEKKSSKRSLAASSSIASSRPSFKQLASVSRGRIESGLIGHVGVFVLKVAALELVRRFSRAKCPFAWRGVQALQVLCYPPFKWIQRFAPFKGLVKGVQMFSRPLLVLSIATAFSEQAELNNGTSDSTNESRAPSEGHSEISSAQTTLDTRVRNGSSQSQASEAWLLQLYEELERQGISLPDRINEDELCRFYTAANGDFPRFLSSIKKTIRWRETYGILSLQELEMWSKMVFWHGFDVKRRPCLIVRLGLGCINLPLSDRPRFAQAIISHVEHGVMHLVDPENPQITVLVDCEGLSPFRIPMQILRTCSSLLQDHFPNRLGCLFVIRLPPVLRVVAQTFIQMLKPMTRKKLKIEGETYRKVLSEYLQTLPSFLGGKCTCEKCSETGCSYRRPSPRNGITRTESTESVSEDENPFLFDRSYEAEVDMNWNCDQLVRTAMLSILIFWVFIALIAGIYDPESSPFFSST
ncbi:hypothetical protein UlMin_013479 [Ulmus minor]